MDGRKSDMATSLRPNPFFDALAEEHRRWLSAFDPQYLKNWERLLNADEEAALAESGVRRWLTSQSVAAEPNEELTGAEQRPDFKCSSGGGTFYVEVTHIATEKATELTGLSEEANMVVNPTPLNRAVQAICTKKTAQCSNQDAPVLVAVGTFHGAAAVFSFSPPWPDMILTGMTTTKVIINKRTMSAVDVRQTSELQTAAFLRFEQSNEICFARSSISGLLLCGLSLEPAWVIGVLHPNPVRPFDSTLLPDVAFGRVKIADDQTGDLRVHWTNGRCG